MWKSFRRVSYSRVKSIARAIFSIRPASGPSTAPVQASSPAARLPLSTAETYRGFRGARLSVAYQL